MIPNSALCKKLVSKPKPKPSNVFTYDSTSWPEDAMHVNPQIATRPAPALPVSPIHLLVSHVFAAGLSAISKAKPSLTRDMHKTTMPQVGGQAIKISLPASDPCVVQERPARACTYLPHRRELLDFLSEGVLAGCGSLSSKRFDSLE